MLVSIPVLVACVKLATKFDPAVPETEMLAQSSGTPPHDWLPLFAFPMRIPTPSGPWGPVTPLKLFVASSGDIAKVNGAGLAPGAVKVPVVGPVKVSVQVPARTGLLITRAVIQGVQKPLVWRIFLINFTVSGMLMINGGHQVAV